MFRKKTVLSVLSGFKKQIDNLQEAIDAEQLEGEKLDVAAQEAAARCAALTTEAQARRREATRGMHAIAKFRELIGE